MKITELARKLHVSARAIRFYEEKELLSPQKLPHNGYRTYNESDIWKLQTILALREAGVSLDDIRQALGSIDAEDVNPLLRCLELQRAALVKQWLDVKQTIETTEQFIDVLKSSQALPLEAVYQLARCSKQTREHRKSWEDQWNYDELASSHDDKVSLEAVPYAGYEEALDLLVRWVSPLPKEKGLDLGAGTGNLTGKLLARGCWMAAIDQSEEMLKQCSRKHPDVQMRLGNLMAIPYTDDKFDFAVTSYALRHLNSVQLTLALNEMRRVLRPGGRIGIADRMSSVENEAHEVSDHPIVSLPALLAWFENERYMTKHRWLNESLCVVIAVPM